MTRVFRIRLPETLDAALMAFCQHHGLNASIVVREAIRHVLEHPGAYPALRPKPVEELPTLLDPRTPAQIANWERYIAEEPPVDLEAMVAGMPDLETIAAQMPPLGESR